MRNPYRYLQSRRQQYHENTESGPGPWWETLSTEIEALASSFCMERSERKLELSDRKLCFGIPVGSRGLPTSSGPGKAGPIPVRAYAGHHVANNTTAQSPGPTSGKVLDRAASWLSWAASLRTASSLTALFKSAFIECMQISSLKISTPKKRAVLEI